MREKETEREKQAVKHAEETYKKLHMGLAARRRLKKSIEHLIQSVLGGTLLINVIKGLVSFNKEDKVSDGGRQLET